MTRRPHARLAAASPRPCSGGVACWRLETLASGVAVYLLDANLLDKLLHNGG